MPAPFPVPSPWRLLWVRERINARLTPHLESAASEVERELNEILDEPNPALTDQADRNR